MADPDLQKKVREFQGHLSKEQGALRDQLEAKTKALNERLKTDPELKQRKGELARQQGRLEGGRGQPFPDGASRGDIEEDIAEAQREVNERTAELEQERNAARGAWRESLDEGQRAKLMRLGADVSRTPDRGGGLTDPIIEQEARGTFEESQGRQDWSQDLGKTAEGKETTLEFTKKNGKNYAVILDSDGNVLEKIEYDPNSESSIKKATKKIGGLGIKDYPGERLMFAFQMAGMVLFVLNAAETIKEMKDPKLACGMLRDYARLMLTGTWDDFSLKIHEWMKDLTGPFHALGGYFNYLNAIGLGAYIFEQLGEPGSTKRRQLNKKLQTAVERACRSLTHPEDEHSSIPGRKPVWLGVGAAAVAAVVIATVVFFGSKQEDSSVVGPSGASSISTVASSINCDCDNTGAPNIGGEAVRQCLRAESSLQAKATAGQLKLEIVDGKIVDNGASLCDPVTSGPAAWPLGGKPAHQ